LINEIYFIPCDYSNGDFDEATLSDIAYWQGLVNITTPLIRTSGKVVASYAKGEQVNLFSGSQIGEEPAYVSWDLTVKKRIYDMEGDFADIENLNKILQGALNSYNVVARYTDDKDFILPIGAVVLQDFTDTHPEGNNEFHETTYVLRWTPNKISMPTPISVAGLSDVIPVLR
jgi:hypothetical protein